MHVLVTAGFFFFSFYDVIFIRANTSTGSVGAPIPNVNSISVNGASCVRRWRSVHWPTAFSLQGLQ